MLDHTRSAERIVPGPYAVPDAVAQNRPHPDDPHGLVLAGFLRDRWRVFHAAAFRRLQYKTQVFVNDEGDHYRTRLTHTLEVAQIAWIVAARLGLNAPLAEVLAIVHDLGHSPFGHAGEAALAECMADHGGFDHNLQALRVIDLLEHPYRQFHGLNLANVVRWSQQLHAQPAEAPAPRDHPTDWRQQPLEGQAVSLADQIAYDVHDVEDAIGAGLVNEKHLNGVALWRQEAEPVRRQWPDAPLPAVRRHVLEALTFRLIDDLVAETQDRLRAAGAANREDFCRTESRAVGFPAATETMLREHEAFLAELVYRHPRVQAMDDKARQIVQALFEAYVQQPRLLPARYGLRVNEQGPHRVVCDYIAGMTDRFCQDQHARLFEPHA